jgi:hypothetical protein
MDRLDAIVNPKTLYGEAFIDGYRFAMKALKEPKPEIDVFFDQLRLSMGGKNENNKVA